MVLIVYMSEQSLHHRQCNVENCERESYGRLAICKMHYLRKLRYGDPTITHRHFLSFSRITELKQVLLKYRKIAPNGCWEWTRCRKSDGYGNLQVDGRLWTAHRISAVVFKGMPIDCELYVLHECDNPPCFNPSHLFLGTHHDNTQDRDKKGRLVTPHGEHNGMAKLTVEKVREARKSYQDGIPSAVLARQYGVSEATMYACVVGKAWKHVV